MFASSLIVAGAYASVAFAMASTLRGGSVDGVVSSVTAALSNYCVVALPVLGTAPTMMLFAGS